VYIIIPILIFSIPIVAILCGTVVKPWMKLQERKLEMEAQMTAEKAAQYAAHTERLEQRMRVLERIVTNTGMDVADEIERLRNEPIN
jgi:hypothetical protein